MSFEVVAGFEGSRGEVHELRQIAGRFVVAVEVGASAVVDFVDAPVDVVAVGRGVPVRVGVGEGLRERVRFGRGRARGGFAACADCVRRACRRAVFVGDGR